MYHQPAIEYLLCCIITLILITLYLGYKAEFGSFLDRLVFVTIAFMLVHIGHIFVCQVWMPGQEYFDWAAPYGLMYGPFYYFSSYSYSDKKLTRPVVFLHLVPFLVGTVFFLLPGLSPALRSSYEMVYGRCLYILLALSFMGYAVRGLLEKGDREYWSEEKRLVTVSGSFMFVAAIYFLIIAFTKKPDDYTGNYAYIRVGAYLIMTAVVCFALRYYVNRLMQPKGTEIPVQEKNRLAAALPDVPGDNGEIEELNIPAYQKSLLPENLLDEYEERLNQLVSSKQSYLDAALSLQGLARELKIPKHHLTQLFSIRIGRNFYQYINILRVEHACKLIRESGNDTLEMLAFESGFNSKTTFNRYFKTQMGCTPSEYRDQQAAMPGEIS